MSRWWERPQIWRSEEEVGERKVGFLDLFYDLIFVVAIAQVAHGLAKHPDGAGLADYLLLSLPIFWVWMGHTFYTDRFENRDMSHIFYTFASMLPVVGMAVFAHGGRGETAAGFALSYAAARLMLVFMFVRAAVHVPVARPGFLRLGAGFGAGALIWAASAFIHDPVTRTLVQVGGLAIDFFVPIGVTRHMMALPPFAEGRLRERFGLLMIIVLGESVAGTVNGLADIHHINWAHGATAFLAMLFAFGVYFTYFEMVPRERLSNWIRSSLARSYLIVALVCSVAATGAGVLATVGHEGEALNDNVRYLLAGALATSYLSLLGLSRVHDYPDFGAGRRGTEGGLIIAIVAASGVGFIGTSWGPLPVLAALAIAASVPWVVGVSAWRRTTKHQPIQPDAPSQG